MLAYPRAARGWDGLFHVGSLRSLRRGRSRIPAILALVAALALIASGCLGSSNPPLRVTVDGGNPAPEPTAEVLGATSTPAPVTYQPTPPPSQLDPEDLHGFTMPIEGSCFPSNETLMPNAPREYRNGVHQGVDFYFGDSCVVIERGTPVLAAYPGVVVRADHDYIDLTLERVRDMEAKVEQGEADEEMLDVYRGRQVWIDHGNGVVTRYAHLHRIAPDLVEGVFVQAGHEIGAVGESGTPESVTAPGTELHLHWEVWVDGVFLGDGLEPDTVRALYNRLMEPAE